MAVCALKTILCVVRWYKWLSFVAESKQKQMQCAFSEQHCGLCGGASGDFVIVENAQKSLQCVLSKPHWGLRGGASG